MTDVGTQAVELLHELVRIDSVNPALVGGAAGETAIVEHLRARLERSGFTVTVIDALDMPAGPASWPFRKVAPAHRLSCSTGISTPSALPACPTRSPHAWTVTGSTAAAPRT